MAEVSSYVKKRAQQAREAQNNSTGSSGAVSDYVKKRAEQQRAEFEERNKNRSAERAALEAAGDRAVLDFIKIVSQPEQPKATTQKTEPSNVPDLRKNFAVPYSIPNASERLQINANRMPSYMQGERSDQAKREKAIFDVTAGKQKVMQLESEAVKVQERGQKLQTQQAALEQSYKNIMALKDRYEKTGDEMAGRSYLLAVEMYNQNVAAYEKEAEKYGKDSKVLADYEKAWQDLQLKQMAYQDIENQIAAKKPENKPAEELRGMIDDLDKQIMAAEQKVAPLRQKTITKNGRDLTPENQQAQMQLQQVYAELQGLKQQKASLQGYLERREALDWESAQEQEILAAGGEDLMDALIDYAQEIELGKRFTFDKGVSAAAQRLKDLGVSDQQMLQWLPYAKRMVSAETYDAQTAAAKEMAQSNRASEIAMSVASVPYNLASGLGIVDVALQKLEKKITGSDAPINYKGSSMAGYGISNAIRTGVTENIEKRTEGKWGSNTGLGNLHSGAYNLAMSMADSLGVLALTAMGVPGATVMLGGSAATATMVEVKERGGTDAQALTMGLIAGAAETLMEKFSVDNLLDNTKTKSAVLKILEQSGTEAIEEGSTNLINTAADLIVMADKSQLKLAVQNYMEQGMSREEAEQAAKKDWLVGLISDVIGGAVSGGVFGAGGNILTADYSRAKTQKVKTEIASKPETTTRKEMDEYVQQNLKRAENLDGSIERKKALGAGVGSDGVRWERAAEAQRRAEEKNKVDGYVQDLRRDGKIEFLSQKAIGIRNTEQGQTLEIIPKQYYTAEMQEEAQKAEALGLEYIVSTAPIRIKANGKIKNAVGWHGNGKIVVQANSSAMDIREATEHEIYHELAERDPNIVDQTVEKLRTAYGDEEIDTMYTQYEEAYGEIYDAGNLSDEQFADMIYQEMLADAYAEYGRYEKSDARKYSERVRTVTEQSKKDAPARLWAKNNEDETEWETDQRQAADEYFDQTPREYGESDLLGYESEAQTELRKAVENDVYLRRLKREYSRGDIDRRTYEQQINEYLDQTPEYYDVADEEFSQDIGRFSLEGYEEVLPELVEGGIQQAATMDPVRTMTGNEFAKGEKDLVTQVDEYFASVGGKAEHPILGEVTLNRKGIKDDIAHGLGRKKAISFLTVPDVIAKGGMIDYQENWKGRGYDTAVVAAPVTIAGDPYMMGVVMIRSKGENRFYVHEVLTESDEGASSFKTGAVKDGEPGDDAPSVISLLRKVLDVKKEHGGRFAVSEEEETSLQWAGNTQEQEIEEPDDSYGDSLTAAIQDTEGGLEAHIKDLPTYVQDRLKRAEDRIRYDLHKLMGTPQKMPQAFREEGPKRILETYMTYGTIPQKVADELFNMAYKDVDWGKDKNAEENILYAKSDFAAALNKCMSELYRIREFAKERQDIKDMDLTDTAKIKKIWEAAKQAKRNLMKLKAANLLTYHDQVQLGRLLKGEITLEGLDERTNKEEVERAFGVQREYEDAMVQLRTYRKAIKASRLMQAVDALGDVDGWKDKKIGLSYASETMERNVRDIAPTKEIAKRIIDIYFKPIHKNEATATRMKKQFRERVQKLELSRQVQKGNEQSESAAVQILGEAQDHIAALTRRPPDQRREGKTKAEWEQVVAELWEKNPNLDKDKIQKAVREFRSIYDELFQMMNDARIRNGYEPVSYRRGYFPHFQNVEQDGIVQMFSKAVGITNEITALPTTISGRTKTFKPGIRWVRAVMERLGGDTVVDAVEGFDQYLDGVVDVICHTDDIQRIRALAQQIRYLASDQAIKERVDKVRRDDQLSEDEKTNAINQIYGEGQFKLSGFVQELDEYANLLANKRSKYDRGMEDALGRWWYNLGKAINGNVASNMVVLSPSSWLTNYIPLVQGSAAVGTNNMLRGMAEAAIHVQDGMAETSDFLTNRKGSERLVQTKAREISGVLAKPMDWIDSFTSESLVRARYYQNKAQGLSDAMALEEADAWAASVMADRSKGATPTIYAATNPIIKAFAQFQLEQKNQFSYLFKDWPEEAREKGLAFILAGLFKYFIGSWLYNEVYEWLIGRRPAFDPIGMIMDFAGDISGYDFPTLPEFIGDVIKGEELDYRKDAGNVAKVIWNTVKNTAEEIPFVGGMIGGGRLPVSSAAPDIEKLVNAAANSEWTVQKRAETAWQEVQKPLLYVGLPFGGSQAKKIIDTVRAANRHGSYSASGNLRYPVFTDQPADAFGTYAKGLIFGTSSLSQATEWVDSGFKGLNETYTNAYELMLEMGVTDRNAWEITKALADAKDSEEQSAKTTRKQILGEADLTDQEKLEVYLETMVSEENEQKEREKYQPLLNAGVTWQQMMQLENAYTKLKADADDDGKADMPSLERGIAERNEIDAMDLTDRQKLEVYDKYHMDQNSESYEEKKEVFENMLDIGLSWHNITTAHNTHAKLNADEELDATQKATAFAKWVDEQKWNDKQKAAIKERYRFLRMQYAEATNYEKFTTAGLSSEAADTVTGILDKLEPEGDRKQVSDIQKIEAITGAGLTNQEVQDAMGVILSENQKKYFDELMDMGMTTSDYAKYRRSVSGLEADKDENGKAISGSKKEKVLAAIDALPVSDSIKDLLYFSEGYGEKGLDDAPWNQGGIDWAGR